MCNLRKNVSTTVRTPVLSSWLHLGSLVLRYKDNLDRGNPPALHFREQGERFDQEPYCGRGDANGGAELCDEGHHFVLDDFFFLLLEYCKWNCLVPLLTYLRHGAMR